MKALQYSKVKIYLSLFHDFPQDKRKVLDGYLYSSVLRNSPIRVYLPLCLRYYYDSLGEQQIIGGTSDFSYTDKLGESVGKFGESYLLDLKEEFKLINGLHEMGLSLDVVCPVMDHELLRPERMNNQSNFAKVKKFISTLEEKFDKRDDTINLKVVSSLDYFGTPASSKEFLDITNTVMRNEFNKYKITNKTLMHAVDSEYKRNFEDKSRSQYYRSREFARLCRVADMGEAYFHAIKMVERAIEEDCSGILTFLPPGAEFDRQVFNLVPELITFS